MNSWAPVAAAALPERVASRLAATRGLLRVAIDGAPTAGPAALAAALVEPLRAVGRPTVHIEARWFWRDASLRLEYGREDVDSYRSWLDADALRREVLDAAVTTGTYLPTLRDPLTNRSTRAAPRPVPDELIILVSGAFLLGRGLPFDRTIHLAQSSATRARQTPAGEAWTLPAFDAEDAQLRPAARADIVVKLDDPRHPAIGWT
jgi:hypothetical protein